MTTKFNLDRFKRNKKILEIADIIAIIVQVLSIVFGTTCILIPIATAIILPIIRIYIKQWVLNARYFETSADGLQPGDYCQNCAETILGISYLMRIS